MAENANNKCCEAGCPNMRSQDNSYPRCASCQASYALRKNLELRVEKRLRRRHPVAVVHRRRPFCEAEMAEDFDVVAGMM